MSKSYQQGIIFDMDNTILQSRINFLGMKEAIYHLLLENQLCEPELEWNSYTASQLIEMGRQSGKVTEKIEEEVWRTVTAFEKEGMHGAKLEDHVPEVLSHLHNRCHLVVLTNNSCAAAVEALEQTGIAGYFDEIVGREQMTELKPSPAGIHYILNKYPAVPTSHWTMVGDSWIDGRAAQDGQVIFIAYKANRLDLERHHVMPYTYIEDIRQLLELDLHNSRRK